MAFGQDTPATYSGRHVVPIPWEAMSKLTGISLRNFTGFSSLTLSFSPSLNVIIGANGTGKTHLLKVLYAACAVTVGEEKDKSFGVKLRNVFRPYED